jgi:hypothetical protein
MAFPARIRFGVEHVERDWLEHGTELHNFKVRPTHSDEGQSGLRSSARPTKMKAGQIRW